MPVGFTEKAGKKSRQAKIGFPPIERPLALEAEALAFGAPEKRGRKRRHFHVLLELDNDRRICWGRPGAASGAEQQFKIHRAVGRHTALLEERRSRMELENRVGSHLRDVELGVKSTSGHPKSVHACPGLFEELRLWQLLPPISSS